MNHKKKRIAALTGALLLIGLAIATLIFAFIDTPWAYDMFKICLGCVIILPVLIYVYLLLARVLGSNDQFPQEKKSDSDNENSN
ncbi:MAG: hypothetical protein Q4F83_01310 [Eubacteriales bacterium]|nr:hypothetical protein [Eubacteriales bacterium]